MASKSGWMVDYANEAVRKEIRKLPDPIYADFDAIREIIENEGIHKIPTQYIERVRGDIWEMRLRGKGTIARALYFKWDGSRLIILCAFIKKTPKIPPRYIRLAEKRAKAFKDGG